MSEKTLLSFVTRLGSNAYSATDIGDDWAELEVTAAQASKLKGVLGKDFATVADTDGSHVILRVYVPQLREKAEANEKVARGSSVACEVVARTVYAVNAPDAKNTVTGAWWEADAKAGAITVNGKDYAIFPGRAGDYYEAPKEAEEAKNWDAERLVYVVTLPTEDGNLTLPSYGVTNLIRRVVGRSEVIG